MNEKTTVGELVYKISGDMDNLKTELKKSDVELGKLKTTMDKTTKSTTGMSKGFGLMKTAIVGFITGALARGIGSLLKSGAELDSLSTSFERLAGDIDVNTTEALASLRKFSAGTVSDKDLILGANRAMVLGVAKNTEEFGQLMQIARLRARDMGLTTTQAFNDIVTGIGRGSPLILDNLGIVIKQNEAYETYAKELGVTSSALTANQKREALKFAVLKQGNEEVLRAGEMQLSYSERIQATTVAVENLKQRLGQALLPAMESVLRQFDSQSDATEDASKKYESLSESLYRVTNWMIALVKSVKLGIDIFVALIDVNASLLKSIGGTFKALKQAMTGDFKGALDTIEKTTKDTGENIKYKTKAWTGIIEDDFKSMGESVVRAIDLEGFQVVSQSASDAFGSISADVGGIADAVEDGSEDAQEALEDFQGKLVDLIEKSRDARDVLEGELSEGFKKFGENIRDDIEDTTEELAKLVVDAQSNISNLKTRLGETDDRGEKQDIREEIKEQEKILEARANFEERQATRIADIRKRLEEAGIDAAQAGLDGLLQVRSIEDEIIEQKRVASLDEFTRLEELQGRRLTLLVEEFITSTNLLREKIAQHQAYENELTNFIQSEEGKRLKNTDVWAKATIERYAGVSDALREVISLQGKIGDMQSAAFNTDFGSSKIPDASIGDYLQGVTNNNKTVNSPVTINANNTGNDFEGIAREMSFEINRL